MKDVGIGILSTFCLFTAIWYILWPFNMFYSHFTYFVEIRYIFPVLVCCAKKNLATLSLLNSRRHFSKDIEPSSCLEKPRHRKVRLVGLAKGTLSTTRIYICWRQWNLKRGRYLETGKTSGAIKLA
jgi:hypothetical protein